MQPDTVATRFQKRPPNPLASTRYSAMSGSGFFFHDISTLPFRLVVAKTPAGAMGAGFVTADASTHSPNEPTSLNARMR